MIETKHLVEFIKEADLNVGEFYDPDVEELYKEYISEIVARLRAYDKLCHDLKQFISRMSKDARNMSSGVDKKENPFCGYREEDIFPDVNEGDK